MLIFFPGEKYGRDVRVIPVDFSEGQHIYPALAEQIQDLNIGILSMLIHIAKNQCSSDKVWPISVTFALITGKIWWNNFLPIGKGRHIFFVIINIGLKNLTE